MGFRIVENPPPKYLEKYDTFIDLYNNSPLNVKEIREKLDWSISVYNQAKEKGLKEGKIIERRTPLTIKNVKGRPKNTKNPPKYYSKTTDGKYVVVKRFYKGKTVDKNVYCGIYDTENQAKQIVDEMKNVNWDKSYLNEIKKRVINGNR